MKTTKTMNKRLLSTLLTVLLLTVSLPMGSAKRGGNNDGWQQGTGPYSIELTNQGLDGGATYRARFTIEGALGIQPVGQGVGSDYAYLTGYAAPDGIITVTMEWIECSDPTGEMQFKQLDVWMGNRYTNGDMMRSDDDQQFTKTQTDHDNSYTKVVYTFNCADYKAADPRVSDTSLTVNASTTVNVGSTQSETVVNLKLILDDTASTKTKADKDDTEGAEDKKPKSRSGMDEKGRHTYDDENEADEGTGSRKYLIPGVIGSLLAGGAAARRLLRKKDPDGEPSEEEEEEEEEEENQPDQYEMEIYKDFGDTLVPGDQPERVSACIIRHPADGGPEFVDEDMTQRIEISAGDQYMAVEEDGMINGWKTALVQAPADENPPEEGVVNFRLSSADAVYTNHLHFRIEQGKVCFAQENLTIPNGYKKEIRLPFAITGMADNAETNIEVNITDKDGNLCQDYELEVVWSEDDRMHYAVIRDVINPESPLAKGIPGEYMAHSLNIKAISPRGFEIEGSLPVLRFYMGINLLFNGDQDLVDQKNDVPCFLQLYDPIHHTFNRQVMMDKQNYTTAETRCWVRLWDYNDETGDVYMIEPVLQDDGFVVRGKYSGDQELIDRLGLKAVPHTDVNGHIYYIVHCEKGVLNAPNRLIADINVKAEYNGQTFEFVRPVRLTSQPMRHFESSGDEARALKEDEETKEMLTERLNTLRTLELTEMYAPLVVYIEMQLNAYTKYYGYDERCVKACYDAYSKVMQGEALADQQQVLANDSLPGILKMWIESYCKTINDCPKWLRIMWGVATLGASEAAAAVGEVAQNMQQYVEQGGDSFFGLWYVGAKVAVREYIVEKAIMLGFGGAKVLVKNWNQTVGKELAKKMGNELLDEGSKIVIKEINSVKNCRAIERAAEEIKALTQNSKRAAETALKEGEKAIKVAGRRSSLAAVQEFGKQRAVQRLQDLQTAMEMARLNPTAANLRLRNQIIMEVQSDKYAMMMMKNPDGIGKEWINSIAKKGDAVKTITGQNTGVVKTLSGETLETADAIRNIRAGFNQEMRSMYKETHMAMRRRLAAKAGIHPDDIMVTNASSSKMKQLMDGDTITFDQDITYYYYHPKTGQVVYFEQEMTRELYNREFYNVVKKNTLPPVSSGPIHLNKETLESMQQVEQQLANRYAKQADQTVIEDVATNLESYGADVKSMTDSRLWSQGLKNPNKVAEAIVHKGKSRFAEAKKMFDEAKGIADDMARMNKQADALNEIFEGCRSNVKTFDIINGRDAQRISINGALQVSDRLRKGIDMMRKLTSDGTTDIDIVEYGLQQIGYSLESICDDLGATLLKVE